MPFAVFGSRLSCAHPVCASPSTVECEVAKRFQMVLCALGLDDSKEGKTRKGGVALCLLMLRSALRPLLGDVLVILFRPAFPSNIPINTRHAQ